MSTTSFHRRWFYLAALFMFAQCVMIIAHANFPAASNVLISLDMMVVFIAAFIATNALMTARLIKDDEEKAQ